MEQAIFRYSVGTLDRVPLLQQRLNAKAEEGWQLREVSTLISKDIRNPGYYLADFVFLMDKGEPMSYFCKGFLRKREVEKDTEQFNQAIAQQNERGYTLVKILHLSAIEYDEHFPHVGTTAHILIFEGKGKMENSVTLKEGISEVSALI